MQVLAFMFPRGPYSRRRLGVLALWLSLLTGWPVGILAQDIPDLPDSIVTPLPPQQDYASTQNSPYRIRVCYNWQCDQRQTIQIPEERLQDITQYFRCKADTPLEQLKQVRLAIRELERIAERQIPVLENDRGGNLRDKDSEGRIDCVDATTNATNYLHFLEHLHLLTRLEVGDPVRRGGPYLGRHYAARVFELDERRRRNGKAWVVDTWFLENGRLPYILPVEDWKAEERPWDPGYSKYNPLYYDYQQCLPEPGELGW